MKLKADVEIRREMPRLPLLDKALIEMHPILEILYGSFANVNLLVQSSQDWILSLIRPEELSWMYFTCCGYLVEVAMQ